MSAKAPHRFFVNRGLDGYFLEVAQCLETKDMKGVKSTV